MQDLETIVKFRKFWIEIRTFYQKNYKHYFFLTVNMQKQVTLILLLCTFYLHISAFPEKNNASQHLATTYFIMVLGNFRSHKPETEILRSCFWQSIHYGQMFHKIYGTEYSSRIDFVS